MILRLKIRQFKSLFTNCDPADLTEGYFGDLFNLRFRNGMVQTDYYMATSEENPVVTGDIVYYNTVVVDDDHYGTKLVDGKIVADTNSGTYQVKILITREDLPNVFKYRFYHFDQQWIETPRFGDLAITGYEPVVMYDYEKLDKLVYAQNIDGIVKIFLPHESLWFGRIKRVYKTDDLLSYDNYYLDRLSEPYLPQYFSNFMYFDPSGYHYYFTQPYLRSSLQVPFYEIILSGILDPLDLTMVNEAVISVRINTNFNLDHFNAEMHSFDPLLENGIYLTNPYLPRNANYTYQNPGNKFWFFVCSDGKYALDDTQLLDVNNQMVLTPPDGYVFTQTAQLYVKKYNENNYVLLHGSFFLIEPEAMPGDWSTTGSRTVSDIGLTKLGETIEVVGTVIYDGGEEHIASYKKISLATLAAKFALKLRDISIPKNINKRISAIAFYYKFEKEIDFQQCFYTSLLVEDALPYNEIIIHSLSSTGIYLQQTIGTLFNPMTFGLITAFDDYAHVNGVCYGLKNNVHYPAIGNGSVQNNIFYTDRFIKGLGLTQIIRLSNIRESLGIHGKTELKQVYVQDNGIGELIFSVKDRVGYGIKNKQSVFEIPEGIIILTPRGIFITDGGTEIFLSEQINNIVQTNYENGRIYFDNYQKKLYFYPERFSTLYVYSFVDKAWSIIIIQSNQLIFDQIYTDPDGITHLRDSNNIYRLDQAPSGAAYLKCPLLDLGNINSFKVLTAVMFDFKGVIMFDGQIITHETRKKEIFKRNLDDREIVTAVNIEFFMADYTELYSIEPEIEILLDEI